MLIYTAYHGVCLIYCLVVFGLTGLKAFHAEYPDVPCYCVCPTDHPRIIDFVRVVSPRDLLAAFQKEQV